MQATPKRREKHVNFDDVSYIPAKRTRRFTSVPASVANTSTASSTSTSSVQNVPAKRQRRLGSSTSKRLKSTPTVAEEDSLSTIIAMNCKLTNEILLAKKQLSEKGDALLKMQQTLHEKNAECQDLRVKIMELESSLEKLRAEQFCNDLI